MKKEEKINYFWKYVLLTVGGILILIPLMVTVFSSFKKTKDIMNHFFAFPNPITLDNYKRLLADGVGGYFWNSTVITVLSVLVVMLFIPAAAYSIARNMSRRKAFNIMYSLLILGIFVPFQVIMIPLVKMYGSGLGLTNNIWLVTFLHIGLNIPSPTFLYSGFITGVPVELDEAALIDGASPERTFFSIIFPLLKPITMTNVVFVALSIWNDYILASTLLSMKEVKTLPLMTYAFLTTKSADYAPMMAGLVLTMLPVMILYLFGQRYIIEGIVAGSVKG